jgi:hypothetical protein
MNKFDITETPERTGKSLSEALILVPTNPQPLGKQLNVYCF